MLIITNHTFDLTYNDNAIFIDTYLPILFLLLLIIADIYLYCDVSAENYRYLLIFLLLFTIFAVGTDNH